MNSKNKLTVWYNFEFFFIVYNVSYIDDMYMYNYEYVIMHIFRNSKYIILYIRSRIEVNSIRLIQNK